jgi:hypothetical protein
MKLDYLKERKGLVPIALHLLSVCFVVLILVKVTGFYVGSARAGRLVQRARGQSKLDPNDLEKYFAQSRAIAEELKKKNLFAPPPPKKHPVSQVLGILGNEALINGKWYRVGDKIGEAKIVSIEPTRVTVEWEGKKKTFCPFDVKSSPEPEKKAVGKKREPKRVKSSEKAGPEEVAEPVAEEDPLAWMGVELSPALRAKLLEKWNGLSDEEKEQMKERWNNMSDEQKQQAVNSMEENIDQM